METTALIIFSAAIIFAAMVHATGLIVAFSQPKLIHRMAIRRQVGPVYLDMDWNITSKESFDDAVRKTVEAIDLSGVAFEKVKVDFEAEQDRKRQEGPHKDPDRAPEGIPGKLQKRK